MPALPAIAALVVLAACASPPPPNPDAPGPPTMVHARVEVLENGEKALERGVWLPFGEPQTVEEVRGGVHRALTVRVLDTGDLTYKAILGYSVDGKLLAVAEIRTAAGRLEEAALKSPGGTRSWTLRIKLRPEN